MQLDIIFTNIMPQNTQNLFNILDIFSVNIYNDNCIIGGFCIRRITHAKYNIPQMIHIVWRPRFSGQICRKERITIKWKEF